jgi:hypothetical protein
MVAQSYSLEQSETCFESYWSILRFSFENLGDHVDILFLSFF